MFSRRDLTVAATAIVSTLCLVSFANTRQIIGSSAYEWNSIPVEKTSNGEVRHFFHGPTATLAYLDIHVTTFNAGVAPPSPAPRAQEELVIIKDGEFEAQVNGEWKRLGPGSVLFNASNQVHRLRNIGPGPGSYHLITWVSK